MQRPKINQRSIALSVTGHNHSFYMSGAHISDLPKQYFHINADPQCHKLQKNNSTRLQRVNKFGIQVSLHLK